MRFALWTAALLSVLVVASGHSAIVKEGETLSLSCGADDGVISSVLFASFGLPEGDSDETFAIGRCHASSSLSVVEDVCRGKKECSVKADSAVFGKDPCSGKFKSLAVSVECAKLAPPKPVCSAKSPVSFSAVPCTFVNRSNRKVVINWCNFDGHAEAPQVLEPLQSLNVKTSAGHVWDVLRESDRALVQSFTAPTTAHHYNKCAFTIL